ncbi:MAG TPA: RNA polymerase sigma factor RpoE [Chromatiaceae bacterium]|nr:RNA polymerase sigma factor RpoE [Chromatiaceae bacterium]
MVGRRAPAQYFPRRTWLLVVTDSKSADQALVERVQQGDKTAFDLLVRKYQQKVLNVIMRYVRDPDEAQDVAQEAFIKAYRALPRFRGDSAFYTWLYRIAINTAKNMLVSRGRRPPGSDVEVEVAEQLDSGTRLKDQSTPESYIHEEEVMRTIKKAMDELPEDLRTAIMLRELEGMSYEEIAEAMSCPIGTVRSRIFRAREAIDKKLKPILNP